MAEGSSFGDYFIPSLFLFTVVGGSFLFAAIAVFSGSNRRRERFRCAAPSSGLDRRATGHHRLCFMDAADDSDWRTTCLGAGEVASAAACGRGGPWPLRLPHSRCGEP